MWCAHGPGDLKANNFLRIGICNQTQVTGAFPLSYVSDITYPNLIGTVNSHLFNNIRIFSKSMM